MYPDNSYLENIGLITIENLKYYLKSVRYKNIRSILLNQMDMDKLAMELRSAYSERFFEPYMLQGVQVKEDYDRTTPPGRIRIVLWNKGKY